MKWTWFVLAAATGALLGGSSAAVLAADPQDARRLVDDLVPEGALVADVFENTGHPWVVGGYFASVDAEGIDREQLLAQAEAADADIERIQVLPGGVRLDGRRGRVELYANLQPPASASIKATPTGPSVLLSSLAGAAAAALAASALRRPRMRDRTDERPSPPVGQHDPGRPKTP